MRRRAPLLAVDTRTNSPGLPRGFPSQCQRFDAERLLWTKKKEVAGTEENFHLTVVVTSALIGDSVIVPPAGATAKDYKSYKYPNDYHKQGQKSSLIMIDADVYFRAKAFAICSIRLSPIMIWPKLSGTGILCLPRDRPTFH